MFIEGLVRFFVSSPFTMSQYNFIQVTFVVFYRLVLTISDIALITANVFIFYDYLTVSYKVSQFIFKVFLCVVLCRRFGGRDGRGPGDFDQRDPRYRDQPFPRDGR